MNDYLQYLVFVGAGIHIIGTFDYIKATVRGETKPNRITWLLWSISPLIGAFASIVSGFNLASISVFSLGIAPLLVFIASFVNKNAYWKLSKFDYTCGVFSALALILWVITDNPLIAIIFAIISDILAGIPTLIKIYKSPQTETITPYITGIISSFSSLFAIKLWVLTEISFPIYLILIQSLHLSVFIYSKYWNKS
ncbi:MAG: hypothetical protein RLZZ223_136 [Candidatus Parcubacteria bacterium]|jgi:hypothetical protein